MSMRKPVTAADAKSSATRHAAFLSVAHTLDRLYEALYHCDTELLRQVFHPEATYATASGGELLQLDLNTYLSVVEERDSPASAGEPYGFDIESIEFAGPKTALAQMRTSMLGKEFIDFLALLEVDQEWRIIAKVFHYQAHDTGRH